MRLKQGSCFSFFDKLKRYARQEKGVGGRIIHRDTINDDKGE